MLSLLVVSLWLRLTAPRTPEPVPVAVRPSSIAVLPFRNTNPDSSYDYLGYGLGADLSRLLGELPGLSVAPTRWPVAASNGGNARALGERLNVGTILQGTVRPAAGQIRVTAHLIDVNAGFDLWSETYDAPAADLLRVQREIAQAIAATLRLPVSAGTTRRAPPSGEAYDAYLAGTYLLVRGDSRDAAAAVGHLARAIRLDSSFALAYAALAEAQMPRHQPDLPPRLTMLTAQSAALRALELDSTLASAHRLLGEIQFGYHRNWAAADSEFQRAIALAPRSPDGYQAYSRFLLAMGKPAESLAMSRRAFELSPLSAAAQEQLGWHYVHARELDLGRQALARAIALDSTWWRPHFDLALLEQGASNYGQARRHVEDAGHRAPLRLEILVSGVQLIALSGQPDSARGMMRGFRAPFWRVPPYLEACLQAALGDRTKAFASLNQAVLERSEQVPLLRLDPRLDVLRADPRFSRLVKRLGLP